jgi:hypothetical protein
VLLKKISDPVLFLPKILDFSGAGIFVCEIKTEPNWFMQIFFQCLLFYLQIEFKPLNDNLQEINQ